MTTAPLVIAQHGGAATRQDLLEVMSRSEVQSALRSGEIVRPRRGIYTLPIDDEALAAAAELGVLLSHRTAALHHGWSVLHPPDEPEMVADRHRRITRVSRCTVRYRDLTGHPDEGPATTPMRTVIDSARDLDLPESLAVADSALRAGKMTTAELARAIPSLPRTGRARATLALEEATALAANPFESGLRALAIGASGRIWQAQAEVRLRTGAVRHADVGCPELRIALEADSHEFHKTRADVRRDCRRYDEMTLAGWLVLRFAWEHVMFNPDWVMDVIAWMVRQRAGSSYGSSLSLPRGMAVPPTASA